MRILFLGDVMGRAGRAAITGRLPALREAWKLDFVVVNGEIVLRDGCPVGEVRAASYGHTLGGAVGMAMVHGEPTVDGDYLASGIWEVDIAGRRYPATVSLKPLYDPGMERVRA